MIIGITGGIGSGKSTIARALAARGYAVYDCDKEAKRIIKENAEVRKAIIGLLGPESFSNPLTPSLEEREGGEVSLIYNTAYVAERVFREPELLERLNGIVHPAVKEDILAKCPDFVESAILYEAGLDVLCDRIIVVEAPEDVRIARTIKRDYQGEASSENINKVRARIRAQAECKSVVTCAKRPLVISNDGHSRIEDLVSVILKNI